MEPYSVLAIPRLECGEMDVYATTQGILALHVSLFNLFVIVRPLPVDLV